MNDINKFTDQQLIVELECRMKNMQTRFEYPLVMTSFGAMVDLTELLNDVKDKICNIDWRQEEDNYEDPDTVLVSVDKGGTGLKPSCILLPHQLYVNDMDVLRYDQGADAIYVQPLWSKTRKQITK